MPIWISCTIVHVENGNPYVAAKCILGLKQPCSKPCQNYKEMETREMWSKRPSVWDFKHDEADHRCEGFLWLLSCCLLASLEALSWVSNSSTHAVFQSHTGRGSTSPKHSRGGNRTLRGDAGGEKSAEMHDHTHTSQREWTDLYAHARMHIDAP